MMVDSLARNLGSLTASMESRGQPQTELALFINRIYTIYFLYHFSGRSGC